MHRWSLYAGSITWKAYHCGPVKCCLYKQVVPLYRWSFEQVWVYLECAAVQAKTQPVKYEMPNWEYIVNCKFTVVICFVRVGCVGLQECPYSHLPGVHSQPSRRAETRNLRHLPVLVSTAHKSRVVDITRFESTYKNLQNVGKLKWILGIYCCNEYWLSY